MLQGLDTLLTKQEITSEAGRKRGSIYMKTLSVEQAYSARDTVARALYGQLFNYLVKKTNDNLDADNLKSQPDEGKVPARFIGVLDLFGSVSPFHLSIALWAHGSLYTHTLGFESFKKNDFEQLLINFANEVLQNAYCKQVLIAEFELYRSEGLLVDDLEVETGTACVELLERGVVGGLDKITTNPNPSDDKFLKELYKSQGKHPFFLQAHPKIRNEAFGIKHYADDVTYTIGAFNEKNTVNVPNLLKSIVETVCSSDLVKNIMSVGFSRGGASKKKKTVAGMFKASMQSLLGDLESTRCSYARCLKPNPQMKPGIFDLAYVTRQLRCLGLLQTCEVLKVGLPTRLPYAELRRELDIRLPPKIVAKFYHRSDREFIEILLSASDMDHDSYHLGFTRLFFKAGKIQELDAVMAKWSQKPKKNDPNGLNFMKMAEELMNKSTRFGLRNPS